MSEVYHLIVHLDDKTTDLYFEDQDTADRTAKYLEFVAERTKKPIRIEAIVQEVYSRETTIEKLVMALNFGFYLGPN